MTNKTDLLDAYREISDQFDKFTQHMRDFVNHGSERREKPNSTAIKLIDEMLRMPLFRNAWHNATLEHSLSILQENLWDLKRILDK